MKRYKVISGIIALIVATLLAMVVPRPAHATAWTMPNIRTANLSGTAQMAISNGQLNNGGATVVGSISNTGIGTPAAPTVTQNGTTGSTSLVYACTGVDINGNATIPSSTTTITNGNATLSATNNVSITCAGKTGALAFLIHKADTAHVLGICYTTSGSNCTFVDNGSVTSTFTYTANTVDQTAHFSQCAGQATLSGSSTTVLNACCTASTDTFFCSDTTTISCKISCASGTITITGSGSTDVVNWGKLF